jgi:hypothetical protein
MLPDLRHQLLGRVVCGMLSGLSVVQSGLASLMRRRVHRKILTLRHDVRWVA